MVDYQCPHCEFEMAGAERYASCPRCHALLPRWELEPPSRGWLQRRREKKAEARRMREAALATAHGQPYRQQNLGGPYMRPPPPPGWVPPPPPPLHPPQSTGPIDGRPEHIRHPGAGPNPASPASTQGGERPPTAVTQNPAPEPREDPERALDDQLLCPNCGLVNRLPSTTGMEHATCQYCRTEIVL